MAKPKGKHIKQKESRWFKGQAKDAAIAEENAPEEAPVAAAISGGVATPAKTASVASPAVDGSNKPTQAVAPVSESAALVAASTEPAPSVPTQAPMSTPPAYAETSVMGAAVPNDASAAPAGYGAPVASTPVAEIPLGASYPQQDAESDLERRRKRAKALKTAGITLGAVVGAVVGIYLVGVAVFAFLFFPNTFAAGADLSMKTSDDAQTVLGSALADHDFVVVGDGIRLNLTSEEAGLGLNDELVKTELHKSVNPWAWPYEVFQHHDITDSFAVSLGSTQLADTLRSSAEAVNATATQPVNATAAYDPNADSFVVVPEQYGTAIDTDRLIATVSEEMLRLPSKIVLDESVLVQPTVKSDSPQLLQTIDAANNVLNGTTTYMLNGAPVVAADVDTAGNLLTISPDLNVLINEEALAAWAAQVAAGYDSIGKARTYTRPDGKVATVEGGDYGWSVDESVIRDQVRNALATATPATYDLPFNSTAAAFVPAGQADWGPRYIDVDLSEQHVRFYDDNGALVWETDCVSGKDTDRRRTPTGVYYIKSNSGSSVLRGFEDDGVTKYESHVRYWMPFVDNAIGLHDADWRSTFGGTYYKSGGSHGCINLPVSAARELSSMIRVGDPVIVHY